MLSVDEAGKRHINRNAAQAANRLTIFYSKETAIREAGHGGKFAVISNDGRIWICRSSDTAFRGRDLNEYSICQIGAGTELLNW